MHTDEGATIVKGRRGSTSKLAQILAQNMRSYVSVRGEDTALLQRDIESLLHALQDAIKKL